MSYYLHREKKCLVTLDECHRFGIMQDDPALYRVSNIKEGYDPVLEYLTITEAPVWYETDHTVTIKGTYTPVTDDEMEKTYQMFLDVVKESMNITLAAPLKVNVNVPEHPEYLLGYNLSELLFLLDHTDKQVSLMVEDSTGKCSVRIFEKDTFDILRSRIIEAIRVQRIGTPNETFTALMALSREEAIRQFRLMQAERATSTEHMLNHASHRR